MNKDTNKYYTIGELSSLTGVSTKAIRHYHEKGLLEPDHLSSSGYRMYNKNSVEILQQILMLKYLDFSLDEIQKILYNNNAKETFSNQAKLLQAKKIHLEQILSAVKEIGKLEKSLQWEKMLEIIHMTVQKESIINQYIESKNLQTRINIHEYSTSNINWYQWILDGLQLHDGMKILEIGCGTGTLWNVIHNELPSNLEIILTDNSIGMLKSAEENVKQYSNLFKQKNIRFSFMQIDADNFSIDDYDFDRIIANHMLYHVSNDSRPKLLQTCSSLLKDDGMFFASTVGKTHLQQLFELTYEFDKYINIPHWMSENFELENGKIQLEKVFKKVLVDEHINDLLVPDPQAIYDYIISLPGNAKEILNNRSKEFMDFLESRISKEKPFFIHKSTGAFRAFK